MNQNERRFFLKRFFSFNTSTISTESAASADEPTQPTTPGQAQASKANTISTDIEETPTNNRGDEPKTPVEAELNMIEQELTKTTTNLESNKMADVLKVETINESSLPPLPSKQVSPSSASVHLLDTHLLSNQIHQQLQHQQSIELKPFRKKEVLIDESLNQEAVVRDELTTKQIPSPSSAEAETKSENQAADSQGQGVLACSLVRKPTVVVGPSPAILPFIPLKYRNLGKCGLRVSQLGLGTWVTFGSQIPDDVAEDIITFAYQSGINLFDTAEVYAAGKAELALGRILKKKKWRRSSYIICTKLFWGGKAETEKGLSRKHIIEGVKASLERLQLEYVDIVFANKPDAHTPMEEIVRAFTHLINNNLAFYWGTSRWNTMEIMEAYSVARQFNLIPPMCEQAEYHLFQRDEVELTLPDVYSRIGIGTMTWSPLASGILTGKYEDGIPLHSRASLKGYGWLKDKILSEEGRKQQFKIRELQYVAEKLGCTIAQLAIAWSMKNESVHCVLLGASSLEQIQENILALQVVPKLTPTVMSDIERILGNKPISRQPSKSENLQKT